VALTKITKSPQPIILYKFLYVSSYYTCNKQDTDRLSALGIWNLGVTFDMTAQFYVEDLKITSLSLCFG